MKRAALCIILMSLISCNYKEPPGLPKQFKAPRRIVKIDVIIDPDLDYFTCKQKGWIWVQGDTKELNNVITGCVEVTE